MPARRILRIAFALLLLASSWTVSARATVTHIDTTYSEGEATSGGTGRFYMGREIAQVMGHRGAAWLDRSSRDEEEAPDVLVQALGLEPTDTFADIGAGSGYFTFRVSPLVPEGRVFAVDIQQEMLDIIGERMQENRSDNVIPVLGAVDDAGLPAGQVDVALIVDAYHEFSHPREMMRSIQRALKPGGRVVLVEYRAEDPGVPIKPLHKMTEEQVRKEVTSIGLEWKETIETLPRQHIIIFWKRPR